MCMALALRFWPRVASTSTSLRASAIITLRTLKVALLTSCTLVSWSELRETWDTIFLTAESPTAEQVQDYLKAVQTSEYVIPQGRPDVPQDYINKVEREVQYWKQHGDGPLSMHCNIWVFGELRQSISQYMNPRRLLYTKEKRPRFPNSSEFPNDKVNFTKCLVCTKPTSNVCGRCKMVRFCCRDCQRRAWETSHKEHCQPARNVSLLEALSENGMYWLSPDECCAISKALGHSNLPASVQRKHYFALAAKLGGVFVG